MQTLPQKIDAYFRQPCSSKTYSYFMVLIVLTLTLSLGVVLSALANDQTNTSAQTMAPSVLSEQHAASNKRFIVKVSGEGQAILLIPGLMSSAAVYDKLAADLSEQYEVHVLSVKGFAGVAPGPAFSLRAFTQDIVAYIQSEQLNKPHIIGHSMGGLTSFLLASEYSTSIGKVISIDGLPFIGPIFTRSNATTVDMLKPQAHNFKKLFASMTAEQLAAQAKQGVFIQATNQADRNTIIEMARTSDPQTAGNAMFDVMTTDLREALKQTNTPMLMLGASGAFMTNEQHAQVTKLYKAQFDQVPRAKVVMNSQVRHFMMFDDKNWVLSQVTAFLGGK